MSTALWGKTNWLRETLEVSVRPWEGQWGEKWKAESNSNATDEDIDGELGEEWRLEGEVRGGVRDW